MCSLCNFVLRKTVNPGLERYEKNDKSKDDCVHEARIAIIVMIGFIEISLPIYYCSNFKWIVSILSHSILFTITTHNHKFIQVYKLFLPPSLAALALPSFPSQKATSIFQFIHAKQLELPNPKQQYLNIHHAKSLPN